MIDRCAEYYDGDKTRVFSEEEKKMLKKRVEKGEREEGLFYIGFACRRILKVNRNAFLTKSEKKKKKKEIEEKREKRRRQRREKRERKEKGREKEKEKKRER